MISFNAGLNNFLKLFDSPKVESNDDASLFLSDISPQRSNVILYVGGSNDEVASGLIQQEFQKISNYFNEMGCDFVFYPALKSTGLREVTSSLSYHFPIWLGHEKEAHEYIQGIDSMQFYEAIREFYGQNNLQNSFFLLVRETWDGFDTKAYSISEDQPINNEIVKLLHDIDRYLKSLKPRNNSISHYNPLERKEKEKYNAEAAFENEASRISREVEEQIQTLLKAGQNKALLNIYSTLLKQTKLYKPELFKKFHELNQVKIETPLSRLVVDKQFRIWLPDYNNLEIEMTPLPKTLYLFFLKRPEGIMLHDLVDHKKELLSIYSHVTNSSSNSEIKGRINDMTDMRKNSLNEKCSRIKEAFVSKLEDSIAQNYYVTGRRGNVKYVVLSDNLRLFND